MVDMIKHARINLGHSTELWRYPRAEPDHSLLIGLCVRMCKTLAHACAMRASRPGHARTHAFSLALASGMSLVVWIHCTALPKSLGARQTTAWHVLKMPLYTSSRCTNGFRRNIIAHRSRSRFFQTRIIWNFGLFEVLWKPHSYFTVSQLYSAHLI